MTKTTVNQEIVDSLAATVDAVTEEGVGGAAMAEQVAALGVALAMQNAVAQQQQLYILQNAATTAMVKAMLDAGPEAAARWAEALARVREAFTPVDIAATLGQLEALLGRLRGARGGVAAGGEAAGGEATGA